MTLIQLKTWFLRALIGFAVVKVGIIGFDNWQIHNLKNSPDHIELQLLHINDLHGQYHPRKYWGVNLKLSPLALIKGHVKARQQGQKHSLFMDAGDAMEKGSVVEYMSQGQSTIEIYSQLGLDLLTLGNHDFAFGLNPSVEFSNRAAKQTLSANQIFKEELGSNTKAFQIYDFDGVKVGVYGLTSSPYSSKNHSYYGAYYQEVEFDYDYVKVSKDKIAKMKEQGAEVIVLLSHLGIKRDKKLANALGDQLALIIGGHSHTTLRNIKYVNDVPIVQAGRYGSHIGEVNLYIHKDKKSVEGVDYKLTSVHPYNMEADLNYNHFISTTLSWHFDEWDKVQCQQTKGLSLKEIAQLVGELANIGRSDWAMIDSNLLWYPSEKGNKSIQSFFDVAPTEIQKPGTNPYSGLFSISLTGKEIKHMQKKHVRDTLVYVAKKELEDDKVYTVITHKKYAHNLKHYYGFEGQYPSVFVAQIFELLTANCQDKYLGPFK